MLRKGVSPAASTLPKFSLFRLCNTNGRNSAATDAHGVTATTQADPGSLTVAITAED